MALHLCGSCSRHVRTTESTCPFCGAKDERRALASPLSRATRAAMVFGAAAAVATSAACGGMTSSGDDDPTVVAAYGAPPSDASTDAAPTPEPRDAALPDARSDADSAVVAAYGAPPPDANVQPPYGSPPPPDAGAD